METHDFCFRVLGQISVEEKGQELQLGGPMRRALLAGLLLNANRDVSTARLQQLLWDTAPGSALANLRNYMSGLRRVVGPRLSSSARGYRLRVLPGELDLERFNAHIEAGRASWAMGEADRALTHYEQATALWSGTAGSDLPAGCAVRRHLEALEQSALTAAEETIAIRLAQGVWSFVIDRARAVLADHPTRERLWGQLMVALYESGDVSGALASYRSAVRELTTHLGLDPGSELTELHRRILNRERMPSATEGAVPTAPSRSSGVSPRQLPHRHRGFVGRTAELESLATALRSDGGVLVVHGPSSVGKTALAVEWAVRHDEWFPDGQLFADLGAFAPGVTGTSAVLRAFVRALGVGVDLSEQPDAEVAALYRSLLADRAILVLLDHVGSFEQVRHLLPGVGASRVLITSRQRLLGARLEVGADELALEECPLVLARRRAAGAPPSNPA
ncbi:AfsR/SARP family transcriptional regulator [Luteipulveratus flavus]|uniref:BTAD domain-containing putative transcriptional regulator n=1 Tax=Luteipulveratus flavus TaxID=3031728 RepID=A0ABT6C4R3_9MICO|nr:BTAD domain-containing putative transcriptional regulator [Luteipulveratus sp. YIM 133296]MDF8263941.1 BTAD domain-containing putative transcriptional regulator [Luteipulveratus sp. YIM 133296]